MAEKLSIQGRRAQLTSSTLPKTIDSSRRVAYKPNTSRPRGDSSQRQAINKAHNLSTSILLSHKVKSSSRNIPNHSPKSDGRNYQIKVEIGGSIQNSIEKPKKTKLNKTS
jgi:hypothetical protein